MFKVINDTMRGTACYIKTEKQILKFFNYPPFHDILDVIVIHRGR